MAATQSRTYSERDMMRMQQDAMERVREMQERVRQTVEGEEPSPRPAAAPGAARRNRTGRQPASPFSAFRPRAQQPRQGGGAVDPPVPPTPAPPPEVEPEVTAGPGPQPGFAAPPPQPRSAPPPDAGEREGTTLIQDIFGAIGLDDDRLLIAGLILLLVNAKADTTLILALCYLLI